MRARVVRFLAAVALVAVCATGAPRSAAAVEVPPLPVVPPLPPAAQPVLTLIAPIASPTCGSASLVALTASSLLPASLGASSLLGVLLSPVFIACGNVPVPDSATQLQCAADDQVYGAISTATIQVIGAGPPVSTRAVGPVVETVYLLPALPGAVGGLGVPGLISGVLACRAVRPASTPAPAAAAPSGVADDTAVSADADAPLLRELGLGVSVGSGSRTATSATDLPAARPIAAAQSPYPFAYPWVFVLPLVLLAVGGYLARSLTDDVRL